MPSAITKVAVGNEPIHILSAVSIALQRLNVDSSEPVGCNADSGVLSQPFGKKMLRRGATNRAKGARLYVPDADIFIGIESGLVYECGERLVTSCVVALRRAGDQPHTAFGTHIPVPEWLVGRVKTRGKTLTEAVQDLPCGRGEDAISWLSIGTFLRREDLTLVIHAALLPLIDALRYKLP